MPTFDTPDPIIVAVDLFVGDVKVFASARADTVVEVRPRDPHRPADVQAAERTRIEHHDGRLLVKEGMQRNRFGFGVSDAVAVTIHLPEGSMVSGGAGAGGLETAGRLGDVVYRTGMGDMTVEEAAALTLKSGKGDVSAGQILGVATVTTGAGDIMLGDVRGAAVLKSGNGKVSLGTVGGDLRLNAANGDVHVARALGGVAIRSANGKITVDEAGRGPLALQTACGRVEVGVPVGPAVWLDASAAMGRIINDLVPSDRPPASEAAVEIRAQTAYGDVVIRRPTALAS